MLKLGLRSAMMLAMLTAASGLAAAELPIFDAHVHYSHDAWVPVPPREAIGILKKAGITRALVSSSDDDGNQKLLAEAPGMILPSLRPYRKRSDVSTWVKDDGIVTYLEERLKKYKYVAVGEFHLFGADADLPVPRRMIALAKQHNLLLHAHSDVEAIERIFAQYPDARVLWAHSGFIGPEDVRAMLKKHPKLWSDLAYRNEHGANGKVPPNWRAAFMEFPDRFLVGTDTFTPERWHYINEHANWSRQWLADLPPQVAERIAYKNGEALFGPAKAK